MSVPQIALKSSRYWGPPDQPHTPFAKQLAFMLLPQKEALYGGSAGSAKVLYDEGVILTPFGFRKGIDLSVGDMVNAPDGSISKIIQLHSRKKFRVWRVHFHDGTYTDVGKEHLWLSWRSGHQKKISNEKLNGIHSAQIIETAELKEWSDTANTQQKRGIRPNWPLIPVCEAQSFNLTYRYPSQIDAYLLGMLLGDGYIGTNISITSNDAEHIKEQLESYDYAFYKPCTYRFMRDDAKKLTTELKKLGLLGKLSHQKFIPKQFLYGSKETRLAVLQGLMDTDGTVDKQGHPSFSSCSKELAHNVAFLVRSIGGTASITGPKKSIAVLKDGRRVEGLPHYKLYIKHRDCSSLFRLQRKKERCIPSTKTLYKQVVKVEQLNEFKTGRCITVSHPSGLYITNDFIVTHNSDCLLMTALQFADVPNYSALIIRRNISDLKMPGNLLDRANKWLKGRPEVRFDGSNHTYYFPTKRLNGLPGEPAKLTFGFLSKDRSLDRYQGGEFQSIFFDELTQFKENEYRYLLSRLRRPLCPQHGDQMSGQCGDCLQSASIPQRVRSATNPGGVGHEWVKNYFKIWKDPDGQFRGHDPNIPYIPAFLKDNPFIDKAPYLEALERLDPVTREQLMRGDWDVAEESRFKKTWIRYYYMRGNHFVLEYPNTPTLQFHIGDAVKIFATMDPAVSRKSTQKKDGKKRSHCVISVWALMPSYDLLLIGHVRFQDGLEVILGHAQRLNREFRPEYIRIETNNMGEAVYQVLKKAGLPVKGVPTSIDKVANSIEACIRMSENRIWIPRSAPWLADWEGEIFNWTGDEDEQDDQVDTLSAAVNEVSWDSFSKYREENSEHSGSTSEAPFIYGWNGLATY